MVMRHCPVCHSVIDSEATRTQPFCGERCRLIDLGRWLDETYSVPEVRKASLEDAES